MPVGGPTKIFAVRGLMFRHISTTLVYTENFDS